MVNSKGASSGFLTKVTQPPSPPGQNERATCKVSSIHVNGWFGDFDKAKGCERFLRERFNEELADNLDRYAFFGDSANDEPLFATFGLSIGVANVRE